MGRGQAPDTLRTTCGQRSSSIWINVVDSSCQTPTAVGCCDRSSLCREDPFRDHKRSQSQAKKPREQSDSAIDHVEPVSRKVERKADQKTHRHHPQDRAKTKNEDVAQGQRRRRYCRDQEEHQGRAAGQPVQHSDEYRSWAKSMMRLRLLVCMFVKMKVLTPAVGVNVRMEFFRAKEFPDSIRAETDQHHADAGFNGRFERLRNLQLENNNSHPDRKQRDGMADAPKSPDNRC